MEEKKNSHNFKMGLKKETEEPGSIANQRNNVPCTPWPATDALGRQLPLPEEVGPPKPDRFVGIFYFLWHTQADPGPAKSPHRDGPYNVTQILEKDPEAIKNPDSPLWGPYGTYHYWGEPLYDYYHSADPWVLRRHAQLLADAGIDTLIFDATNASTYPDVYLNLCKVFHQVREEGGRTPQIVFMVNAKAGETAQTLYEDFYKKGLYRELWFHWQGKPLLICDPKQAGPEVKHFFTLRGTDLTSYATVNTPYLWKWMATYPQPYGYTDDPEKPEQMSVSAAECLRRSDGAPIYFSSGACRGRSFHDGKQEVGPGAVNHGYNFQEQWKQALELNPPFVMVTGWNEWIAGRYSFLYQPRKDGKDPGSPIEFWDQFTQEFSRDIEPMQGGHGDNYYLQLVSNVRRFKGAPALPKPSAPRTISIEEGFEQWQEVGPEFLDHAGETIPRDYGGGQNVPAGFRYTNHTGRNDLVAFKVARDDQNVYFYARTREAITSHNDQNWMWLLINSDQNTETGWEGYDFIVNRTVESDGETWLEQNEGGWHWKKVAPVRYRVQGNDLHLAIPRAALGLPEGKTRLSLDFKWADNIQHPGNIMDFYVSGDVAPEGRFRYRY